MFELDTRLLPAASFDSFVRGDVAVLSRIVVSGSVQLEIPSGKGLLVRALDLSGLDPDALNDVVVSRGASGRAVELDLSLDDKPVARVLCDGIIVSTPTGSTAYSLSAGGPILLPDTPAVVISMICPHTLTSRPLVMRDTARIALRAVACEAPMIVSSDGRDDEPLHEGDTVLVARSPRSVPLIALHGYNPCDVLRRKLGWGGRSEAGPIAT
jgi:NAD kinase